MIMFIPRCCVFAALKPGYFANEGLKPKTISGDTGHDYYMDEDAKLCPRSTGEQPKALHAELCCAHIDKLPTRH